MGIQRPAAKFDRPTYRRAIIAAYWTRLRSFRRDVRLFFVASFVFSFTINDGIYPVLFNLYLLRLGYGPEFIGAANAVNMLGYALFSLPAGFIARRLGIRRAMIGGLGLAAMADLVLPLAELLPAGVVAAGLTLEGCWVLAMGLLSTLGMAMYYVTSVPFLMGATARQNRNHAYSVRMGVSMLAGCIGSLTGGLLPSVTAALLHTPLNHPVSYRYPLMLAAALSSLGVATLLATRDISEEGAVMSPSAGIEPVPVSRRDLLSAIAMMAFIAILRPAGLGVARTFFNVYLDAGLGISTARIGLIFALIQITSVPATLAMPVLAARVGNFALVTIASLAMTLSVLPMAISNWIAVSLGRLGTYAFSGISDAALGVYQMEIVPPRWRPTMAGATATTFGLAWAAISYGGGRMIAAWGYPPVFLLSAAIGMVGITVFWAYFRRPRGEFARLAQALSTSQQGVGQAMPGEPLAP